MSSFARIRTNEECLHTLRAEVGGVEGSGPGVTRDATWSFYWVGLVETAKLSGEQHGPLAH